MPTRATTDFVPWTNFGQHEKAHIVSGALRCRDRRAPVGCPGSATDGRPACPLPTRARAEKHIVNELNVVAGD
eukprot:11198993-Lingulodinium_polyedra.AAC.1